MKSIAHVLTAAVFVLASCTPAQPAVPAVSPTATASAAATQTSTPTPPSTSTPLPTPTLALPVQPLTPVPSSNSQINAENVKDLREIARYYGQVDYAAKLTKDKQFLFILDPDGLTRYNYETMEPLVHIPLVNPDSQRSSELQMSGDGNWLLIDNNWLLDLRNDKEPQLHVLSEKIKLLNLYSREFSLSPDGSMIAAEQIRCYSICDYQLQIVSTEDFKVLHVSTGESRQEQPTFSPDGTYLAVADMLLVADREGNATLEGALVTLRNTKDFVKVSSFPVNTSPFYITGLAFSQDSRLLAVAQRFSIDVFDIATGTIEATITDLCDSWDRQVIFASLSPLEIAESSSCENGNDGFGMWTIAGGNATPVQSAKPFSLSRVSFDNNGNPETIPYPYPSTALKSYSQQNYFKFLSDGVIAFKRDDEDTRTNHSCQLSLADGTLDCQSHNVLFTGVQLIGKDILLGTDGQYFSFDASRAGIDINSLEDQSRPYYSIHGQKYWFELLALDPMNKLLFYQVGLGNDQYRILIEDVESGDIITKWEGQTAISSIAFSEDGKLAALCRSIGFSTYRPNDMDQLLIFDLMQRKTIFSMDFTCRGDTVMALTADGSKLAVQYHYWNNPTDAVWSIRTMILNTSGSFERKHLDIESTSQGVAFSPDDSILAIACGDASTCFLDPSDGSEIYRLQAHSGLTDLAFSKDGSLLAASSQWGLVGVWGIPPFSPKEKDAEAQSVSQLPVCLPGDQILDFSSTHKFQVEPVDGVSDYLWQFAQAGVVLWESSWYGAGPAESHYEITPDIIVQAGFTPGPLEVWVWPFADRDWKNLRFISACLQGEANETPITQTPQPEPATESNSEPGLLYSEDFEDGKVEGWTFDGGAWAIKQEADGNHYWNAMGTVEYPSANYDSLNRWTDFAFEARFRFTASGDKSFFMTVRSSSAGSYIVDMTAQGYIHLAVDDAGSYKVLKEGSHPIKPLQWYLARVEVQENELRLYINDELVMAVEDSTLQSGSIGIFVYGGNPVLVDDMKVESLTP